MESCVALIFWLRCLVMCVVPSRWVMVGFGVMEHTHDYHVRLLFRWMKLKFPWVYICLMRLQVRLSLHVRSFRGFFLHALMPRMSHA